MDGDVIPLDDHIVSAWRLRGNPETQLVHVIFNRYS
jgi:hypothetical protein